MLQLRVRAEHVPGGVGRPRAPAAAAAAPAAGSGEAPGARLRLRAAGLSSARAGPAHPCPHRWRWASQKAAATLRTSKSGGGSGGLAPPCREARAGRSAGPVSRLLQVPPSPQVPAPGPLEQPVARGVSGGRGAEPGPTILLGPIPPDPHQPGSRAEESPALTPSRPMVGRRWGPQQPPAPSTRGSLLCGSAPAGHSSGHPWLLTGLPFIACLSPSHSLLLLS